MGLDNVGKYLPVYGTFHISGCQKRKRVASVDGECGILWFCPFPLPRLVILDLQRGYWLAEKQGPGSQVCVESRVLANRNGAIQFLWRSYLCALGPIFFRFLGSLLE